MKNLFYWCAMVLVAAACNNTPITETPAELKIDLSKYPADLQKIFAKHGSLVTWKKNEGTFL